MMAAESWSQAWVCWQKIKYIIIWVTIVIWIIAILVSLRLYCPWTPRTTKT